MNNTRHAEYLPDLAKLPLSTLLCMIRRAQKIGIRQGACLVRRQKSKYPRSSLTFHRKSKGNKQKTNVRLHLLVAVYNWKKAHPAGPPLWPDDYQVSHDCHNRQCVSESHIHAVPDNQGRSNLNCPGLISCNSCKTWVLVCNHATRCLTVTPALYCSNCKKQ